MEKRKQQSFEYGAVILLISTALSKIIGAAFKIPLTWVIGDLGFGYYSSAYDLFVPIYGLAMAGLPIAISRMVAERVTQRRFRDVRRVFSVAKKAFAVTGIVGLVLMLLLIYPFVQMTDATGGSVYSIVCIAPSILFCCVLSAYRGYFEGMRNMFPTAISDVIEALSKLIFGYTFAFIVMRYSGNVAYAAAAAIMGITLGTALSSMFLFLRYKLRGDGITQEELATSPEPEAARAQLKTLITIAIPVVMTSLATNIAGLIDVSMVKWQLGRIMDTDVVLIRDMYYTSIADYNRGATKALTDAAIPTFLYGIRGKAFTIYNLVPTISSVLGVSALPVLASVWTTDRTNKPEIKKNIESIMKFTGMIAIPAGIGMAALAPQIMNLMYDGVASVQIGGPMLAVFGAAAIFAGLSAPLTSMLQSIGKQILPVRNIAIGAAVKVIVNFILVGIPEINIHGAPIGTLCSFVFIFVANLVSLVRHSGVMPNLWTTLGKPFLSALLCGLAAFSVVRFIGDGVLFTVLAIIVAVAVYLAFLIALRTFTEADILAFPKGEKLLALCKKFKIIK